MMLRVNDKNEVLNDSESTKLLYNYLIKKIPDFNIGLNDFNFLRISSNVMINAGNKYIIRIRRIRDSYEEETVVKKNISHTDEVFLVRELFQKLKKENILFNPIPDFIHLDEHEGHVVSVYKFMIGERMRFDKLENINCQNIGIDLSKKISLIHNSMIVERRVKCELNKMMTIQKLKFDKNKNEIKSLDGNFNKIYDVLVSYLGNNEYRYCSSVLVHGALESGHIFTNENYVTAIIDWEHYNYSENGFLDLVFLYANFVIGFKVVSKEYKNTYMSFFSKRYLFWKSFIESYVCPIKKRILTNDEIKKIEFAGFLRRYYQAVRDTIILKKHFMKDENFFLNFLFNLFF